MARSVELIGILNATPNSFSDGGKFLDPRLAIERTQEMFDQGADYVDIGAEATNPWAEPISVDEEWRRLEPIISILLPAYAGLRFSIDTRHPEVVERAAKYGRFMVNDVTTFVNPEMIRVTAENKLWAITSHLPLEARGDIQFAHEYLRMTNITQVLEELEKQVEKMTDGGIDTRRIIIDPGIGFAKSHVANWTLAHGFSQKAAASRVLKELPIMYGISRKRFLETDQESGQPISGIDRFGNPKVTTDLAQEVVKAARGTSRLLFRVHDVAAHRKLFPKATDQLY